MSDEQARYEALIDREAIGEALAADEREFVERYEAARPELARERALFEAAIAALRGQVEDDEDNAGDELGQARAAAAALARYRSEREAERPSAWPRRLAWTAGVAAAAGLAIWLGLRSGADEEPKLGERVETPSPRENSEPPRLQPVDPRPAPGAPVDASGRLSLVRGEGLDRLDGLLGRSFAPGEGSSELFGPDAEVERACVSWTEPIAVVCFEGQLSPAAAPRQGERRVRLESGRLVAALAPLGPGQRFTVETLVGTVSAIGTVFAVEIHEGRTWVTVLEGRVELRDPTVRALAAGQRTSLRGEVPGDEPTLRTSDAVPAALVELVELAQQLRADPDAALALAEDPSSSAAAKPSAPARPASAKQLAEAAQRHRMARDYDATARVYRELLERYPDSPEAANVPVRLGDLLASTGDHQGALEAYELYLERGAKQLAPEAEYGRIRALRALGREAEERAAIAAFIAARPDDYRSVELRDRLAEFE